MFLKCGHICKYTNTVVGSGSEAPPLWWYLSKKPLPTVFRKGGNTYRFSLSYNPFTTIKCCTVICKCLQILIAGLRAGCKLIQPLKWQHHLRCHFFSLQETDLCHQGRFFSLAEASLQHRGCGQSEEVICNGIARLSVRIRSTNLSWCWVK